MEFTGKIKSINKDFLTGEWEVTFTCNENSVLAEYDRLKDCDKLKIRAVKYTKRRSLNANALLWVVLGKMADTLRTDKWDIYLQMLKRYGKYTYIVVKPSVVDAVKKQWREVEDLGEIEINGQKGIQLLCYFGSSTLDNQEMSVLIDGVISEAKELGIETLPPDEVNRMKEQWGGVDIG